MPKLRRHPSWRRPAWFEGAIRPLLARQAPQIQDAPILHPNSLCAYVLCAYVARLAAISAGCRRPSQCTRQRSRQKLGKALLGRRAIV